MKTIELKEIELTQEQDRFKVESYPSKGFYLVKQDQPKGLGELEFMFVDDIGVGILPNKAIQLINESQLKTDQNITNNQLTESFVLELVKTIINK